MGTRGEADVEQPSGSELADGPGGRPDGELPDDDAPADGVLDAVDALVVAVDALEVGALEVDALEV
ncbi:MAG: hypothetical protein L0G49_13930, partial [Luteococcus sp.]|uniref:hypothetical protein n=1 Tax=Luteococcus sp. TaxID=1969402 RepID=UPI0026486ACC